jgi:signal transduction histidine kinase
LERELALKKVNFQKQTDELNALDDQLTRLSKAINSYQVKIESESVKKTLIQNEISRLRTMSTNIRGLQDQPQGSDTEKEKRIAELNEEVERLRKIVLSLTKK